ncbi:DDE-type integrase/transposase/recombinase [Bacillus sp. CRN 9]|nr:DDE-type integrase/transposase/recombinase [Bacillus sp. CRN 9]
MEISENMLFQYSDETIIRVVFFNRVSSIIYVIDMEKNRWPYLIHRKTIYSLLDSGELKPLSDDPYIVPIAEDDLSKAEIERCDRAWGIVNFIITQLEREELIYSSKYREKAIKTAVDVYSVNYSTIKNYLIKYWKGGKIRQALLPAFRLCGAKGKDKERSSKKRGRPRKDGAKSGVNVDYIIRKYFEIGLNRYYYNERQNSLKTTYELIIKDFFTNQITDHEGHTIPVIKDITQIPTYPQFLYWYKKLNDPKKELIKRKGTRDYFQNHRTIIGTSTQDAGLGPGTLWQVDTTQFDIYLVSSVNRNLIVGRPTLICVIDSYSRMIVGFNVTFEPFNSYTGVMMALINSMTPKDNFCLQYGITLDKGEWDVNCIPQRIFADRGELNGKQIEDAIANLGISIQNAPPFRADNKGTIEQLFHQLNLKIKPFADGVVKNNRTRGDEEYRLKANLTIQEFTKLIIKCVLFHNNHHVLSDYVLDEMMLDTDVEKIPAKIWEFGLKNKKGQLRVLPENTIKMHLLPTESRAASVTARGVKYKKMLYASEYTLKNHWFQTARINGSWKIKIWYDPRDLTHIFTLNEDGEFHKLTLLDHLTKYRHKGIEEIDEIIRYEESLDRRSKKKELQEKMKLYEDIESIVGEGRKRTIEEKNDNLSKTKRLRGIRENQKVERERLREVDRIENDENILSDEINIESSVVDERDDELDMFRFKGNLDWNDVNE